MHRVEVLIDFFVLVFQELLQLWLPLILHLKDRRGTVHRVVV